MRTPINRSTAYEPQANRTTYDTVFNSDAAQMIKFESRVWPRNKFSTLSSWHILDGEG